jgi:hypothetical protein
MGDAHVQQQEFAGHSIAKRVLGLLAKDAKGLFRFRPGSDRTMIRWLAAIQSPNELKLAVETLIDISINLYAKGCIAASEMLIAVAGSAAPRLPRLTNTSEALEGSAHQLKSFSGVEDVMRAPEFGKAPPKSSMKLSRFSDAVPRRIR